MTSLPVSTFVDKPLTTASIARTATFYTGAALSCFYTGLCVSYLAAYYWVAVYRSCLKDGQCAHTQQ